MPSRFVSNCGRSLLAGAILLSTAACSFLGFSDDDGPDGAAPPRTPSPIIVRQNTSGSVGTSASAYQSAGQSVNAFLWRAALDTVSFLPLLSADPYTGVIITDWYAPPATPTERFKINLYIKDATLRADGVKVTVFRQVNDGNQWRDSVVASETASQLEDTVLTRARQLRIQQTAK